MSSFLPLLALLRATSRNLLLKSTKSQLFFYVIFPPVRMQEERHVFVKLFVKITQSTFDSIPILCRTSLTDTLSPDLLFFISKFYVRKSLSLFTLFLNYGTMKNNLIHSFVVGIKFGIKQAESTEDSLPQRIKGRLSHGL